VTAVDVGVGHKKSCRSESCDVEIGFDAGTIAGDQSLNLLVAFQNLVRPCFSTFRSAFPNRQDRLEIARLRASSPTLRHRVALDDETVRPRAVVGRTVDELAGSPAPSSALLRSREIARVAAPLDGPGAACSDLATICPPSFGFPEPVGELLVRGFGSHQRTNGDVAELALRSTLELRLCQANGHDRREALAMSCGPRFSSFSFRRLRLRA